MKPILILPPDTMESEDIKQLQDNGFCVVVAKDPKNVNFLDPIPAIASRTEIENAAIKLSRKILDPSTFSSFGRDSLAKMFIDILLKGTPLDPRQSQEEREDKIFNEAKVNELQRLAREDAKLIRDTKKKNKASELKDKS